MKTKLMSRTATALTVAGGALITHPAFAQATGNVSDMSPDGSNYGTGVSTVVKGVLAFIALIAAASIGIEVFWKGHQKAKQTVKKL